MLLNQFSRYFVRQELSLKAYRNFGEPLAFRAADGALDVVDILTKKVAAGKAAIEVKVNDTVRITEIDVRPKQGIAVFLFRRRDEHAATQVFEHGETRKLRKPDKHPREAPAISAHLFVDLKPQVAAHPTHRAILEEVPGLGRTYVQNVLRSILREVEYEFEDDKKNKKHTYTIPELGGLPSETLGQALKGGGIKYVELVRPARLDGLDTAGLIPHPERMRLSVRASKEGPLSMLQRVRDWAGNNHWSDVRVQVETDDDRTRVVQIARAADAADVLFVRSELVDTKKPLDPCTDVINDELVTKARAMFATDAGWK